MKMEPSFDDAEQLAQFQEIRSSLQDWYLKDSDEGFCWSMDREAIIDPITRRSVGSRLVFTLERYHAPMVKERQDGSRTTTQPDDSVGGFSGKAARSG